MKLKIVIFVAISFLFLGLILILYPNGKPKNQSTHHDSIKQREKRLATTPQSFNYGVVNDNVVSLRSKPDQSSERISQALFGQSIQVLNRKDGWLLVKTWDDYKGWISSDNVILGRSSIYASQGAYAEISQLFADIVCDPNPKSKVIITVTIGARLEIMETNDIWIRVCLPSGRAGYIRRDQVLLKSKSSTGEEVTPTSLINTAKKFKYTRYLWGGSSPYGIDCSGFIQLVCYLHGICLPRDAHMQAKCQQLTPINRSQLRAGDVIFFSKRHNVVTHVGMMVDSQHFIHSCKGSGVTTSALTSSVYNRMYWGAARLKMIRS